MRNNIRRIILFLVVLGIIAYGGYRVLQSQAQAQSGALKGSGTIEATEITIATDSAGRIKDVLAAEGARVQAGQVLVQFDDAILQAQRKQAEAALAAAQGSQAAAEANHTAAQANLDQVKAGARPQEIMAEQQAVVAAQGRVNTAQGQLSQ